MSADARRLCGPSQRSTSRHSDAIPFFYLTNSLTPLDSVKTSVVVDNHVLPPAVVDHAAILLERLSSLNEPNDAASGRRIRATRIRKRGSSLESPSNESGRVVFEHVNPTEHTVERISVHTKDVSRFPSTISEHSSSEEKYEELVFDRAQTADRDTSLASHPIDQQQTNIDLVRTHWSFESFAECCY